jgi:glycine/D-amino acid oxidase-like deaminating enzyme/nitrite reductase/ring-hydroxylating ferredoxin subunit
MTPPAEHSVSVWMETASVPVFTPLGHDTRADVCVVGAGIAGLSTAYLLARAGKKVAVVDDGPIARGQTRRTTAHLSNAIDDRYVEIERVHGQEGARLAADSHSAAVDHIETLCTQEEIQCHFRRVDGYLFGARGEDPVRLYQEREVARRAGLANVEVVPRAPIDAYDTGPALHFPRQGQMNPLKYVTGLALAFERRGGRLYTGTHVKSITGGNPAEVASTAGPSVICDAVVVATNTPINDLFAIHTKQAPYTTYAVALRIPRGGATRALYWDTLDPYHYVRLMASDQPGERLLIVGGEDHKTGQHLDDVTERYKRLEAWARERWPSCGPAAYQWSGQVMETVDGLAFIGRNPLDADNVFIATGDSGMGMTHGTIAGLLLTDLILGRENPWAKLYDPARKRVKAAGEFAKENLNVAAQYLDWMTGGDVKSVDDIEPGHGAVLRKGLHKLAVYRDDQVALHECSATCPHLGCVVHWNDGERTWDCPCHGSRFDAYGRVLNGPANVDLAPAVKSDAAAERKGAGERAEA